jgi:F-type H+-transporting ATPase subunit delta
MNYSKIGVRYAKALLLVSVEQNILDEVRNDMLFIDKISSTVPDFNLVMNSPIIRPSEKIAILKSAISTFVSETSFKFIQMVIIHRRENRLSDIIRNFHDQFRAHQGILTASLTTPVQIDKNISEQISLLLSKKYNKIIELTSQIEPNLIGGFVLQVEDLQYDGSIQTQLRKIKRELINTPLNQ